MQESAASYPQGTASDTDLLVLTRHWFCYPGFTVKSLSVWLTLETIKSLENELSEEDNIIHQNSRNALDRGSDCWLLAWLMGAFELKIKVIWTTWLNGEVPAMQEKLQTL